MKIATRWILARFVCSGFGKAGLPLTPSLNAGIAF